MKKKKTKQQNKTNKKNVFQIVALALISLVLLGAVIDVANDLVKEEDPTEDVLPDDEQPGENVTPGPDGPGITTGDLYFLKVDGELVDVNSVINSRLYYLFDSVYE